MSDEVNALGTPEDGSVGILTSPEGVENSGTGTAGLGGRRLSFAPKPSSSTITELRRTQTGRTDRTDSARSSPPSSSSTTAQPLILPDPGQSDTAKVKAEQSDPRPSLAGTKRRFSYGLHHSSGPTKMGKTTFLHSPLHRNDCEGTREMDARWVSPEAEATEWLSLFYDLVVVAVLTVFSSTHELSSPSSIPVFLSYFVILFWMWSSQTHYDIRYQSEDVYHRCLKILQIACLVYIGAASGNWNPGDIQDPDTLGVTGGYAADRVGALHSFLTVTIAFAASRAILAFQYALAAWMGRQAGRATGGLLVEMIGLIMSMALVIVAAALPATSSSLVGAKIGLFYSSIIVEIIAEWVLLHRKLHRLVPTVKVAERYGAFTLIILGEGFISLIKAFSKAISGLSTNNTETYGQVVVAIVIISMLFLFLFGRFSHSEARSQHRALLWELIHFPLHFGLLLLLAAMVNYVVTLTYVHGMDIVVDTYNSTMNATLNSQPISSVDQSNIRQYLDKLDLVPGFEQALGSVTGLVNMLNGGQNPPYDPEIVAWQYFGQVIVATTESYGVTVSTEMSDNLKHLYGIDATYTTNTTVHDASLEEAQSIVVELVEEPVNEAMSGTLWLFPTAGGVLILCAARSMLWRPYHGLAHRIVHGTQYVGGLILALLGLLDIGGKTLHLPKEDSLEGTNPFYHLVASSWALGVVGISYSLIYFVPIIALWVLHNRRGDVLLDEESHAQSRAKGVQRVGDGVVRVSEKRSDDGRRFEA